MRTLSFLMVVVLFSCNRNKNQNEFQYVKDFYIKAKAEEHRIDVLSNIAAGARGLDPVDSSYRVSKIDLKLDSSVIFLPVIKRYMSDEQIREKSLNFNEEIVSFGKFFGLSQEEALDSVKVLSTIVMDLMNKLKSFEINGRPQLKMIFLEYQPITVWCIFKIHQVSNITIGRLLLHQVKIN